MKWKINTLRVKKEGKRNKERRREKPEKGKKTDNFT
jgi:hypothetical protein